MATHTDFYGEMIGMYDSEAKDKDVFGGDFVFQIKQEEPEEEFKGSSFNIEQNLDDLEYFRMQLYSALAIPKEYLQMPDASKEGIKAKTLEAYKTVEALDKMGAAMKYKPETVIRLKAEKARPTFGCTTPPAPCAICEAECEAGKVQVNKANNWVDYKDVITDAAIQDALDLMINKMDDALGEWGAMSGTPDAYSEVRKTYADLKTMAKESNVAIITTKAPKRNATLLDTGYVYAPYVPIFVTPTFMDPPYDTPSMSTAAMASYCGFKDETEMKFAEPELAAAKGTSAHKRYAVSHEDVMKRYGSKIARKDYHGVGTITRKPAAENKIIANIKWPAVDNLMMTSFVSRRTKVEMIDRLIGERPRSSVGDDAVAAMEYTVKHLAEQVKKDGEAPKQYFSAGSAPVVDMTNETIKREFTEELAAQITKDREAEARYAGYKSYAEMVKHLGLEEK